MSACAKHMGPRNSGHLMSIRGKDDSCDGGSSVIAKLEWRSEELSETPKTKAIELITINNHNRYGFTRKKMKEKIL